MELVGAGAAEGEGSGDGERDAVAEGRGREVRVGSGDGVDVGRVVRVGRSAVVGNGPAVSVGSGVPVGESCTTAAVVGLMDALAPGAGSVSERGAQPKMRPASSPPLSNKAMILCKASSSTGMDTGPKPQGEPVCRADHITGRDGRQKGAGFFRATQFSDL